MVRGPVDHLPVGAQRSVSSKAGGLLALGLQTPALASPCPGWLPFRPLAAVSVAGGCQWWLCAAGAGDVWEPEEPAACAGCSIPVCIPAFV